MQTSILQNKYWRYLIDGWWFILSALLLLQPALENGYPILHPDSGSYILFGFLDNQIPVSRPITYCWLVRHISMYYSLWLVVIFQALVMTAFLNMLVYRILGPKMSFFLTFVLTGILSLFTGLPLYASYLMPDMWVNISFIGFSFLLMSRKLPYYWFILIAAIAFYATIVHFSNIPIITGTLAGVVILFYLFRRFDFIRIHPRKLIPVALILLLAWLSIPSINAYYGVGFKYSRVSNVVYTARLISMGILEDYVNERCETDTSFFLCEYRNVIPKYTRYHYFLWHDTSFLYDGCEQYKGFADCWLAKDSIYGTVVDDVLGIPKYRNHFIRDAFAEFGNQLVTFHLIPNTPFGEKSHINYPIKTYFPREHGQYLAARQQSYRITYDTQNVMLRIITILSLAVITGFMVIRKARKYLSKEILTFMVFFVVLYLVNSAFLGVVSVVSGRYSGRIIWLLPVIAFVLVARAVMDLRKSGKPEA